MVFIDHVVLPPPLLVSAVPSPAETISALKEQGRVRLAMGASSSSTSYGPPSSSITCEVFLSYRGEDTGGFAEHLCGALRDAGSRTYMDNGEMMVGETMGEKLMSAIEESRYCVVVISSGYAGSEGCLRRLATMFRSDKEIIPVFYNVDPYEVRNQCGPFEIDFVQHKRHHTYTVVEEWMHAMAKVGKLKGFRVNDHSSKERQVIQDVVERVSGYRDNPSRVVDRRAGIDSHVEEEIMELLCLEEGGVKTVGIYGMGAVGMATLAREKLGRLPGRFEHVICMQGIKDRSRSDGLQKLQREFISKAFKDYEEEIYSSSEGINKIKRRFRNTRALVILDDVDDRDQLNALAGRDCFGEGTRIVVTARDVQILDALRVDRKYEAQRLRWINESSSSPHELRSSFGRHADYHQGTDHHFRRQGDYPQQGEEGFDTFHAPFRPRRDQEEDLSRFRH